MLVDVEEHDVEEEAADSGATGEELDGAADEAP